MVRKLYYILLMQLIIVANLSAQDQYRNGVFLHHSTGGRIYDYNSYMGVNECSTSVINEVEIYNTTHNFTGEDTVSMSERWFPSYPSSNGWYEWHYIMDNNDPVEPDDYNWWISLLDSFKVIVIKACIPSSHLTGYGSPDDTTGSGVSYKTVYNYKWHWRSMLEWMESHPENFFVIWTGAPACSANTTSQAAQLAHEFNSWAKDTLSAGMDELYGEFPANVYVFDFFHYLVDENYYLSPLYRVSEIDDHPNAAAADYIAPLFVQEVFDAARAYEFVPVELTSFKVTNSGDNVELTWSTATELNNSGFEIQRKTSESDFESIAYVNGQGTTTQNHNYSYKDKRLNAGKYYYRLKQIDFDGKYDYSKIVEIDISHIGNFILEQNYPNPFNPSTKISWKSPVNSFHTLKIFDVLGNEVTELISEYLEAGNHEIEFNTNSSIGRNLTSGVYFYRLTAGDFIGTRKFLLLK